MRLEKKVVMITGAATGIGRETAILFAKEGAKLILTDINEENGNQVVNEIQGDGGEAIFLKHDVSSEDNWKNVVEEAVTAYSKIDVLMNNAGIYIIKPLADTTLEDWNKLMDINVTGVFLGMKHVAPIIAKQQKGSIINLSSVAGLQGFAGHTLYGASKGAVRTMTKDVAMEYARENVRVNSIHPGYIATGMAEYGAEKAKTTTDDLGKMYPLGHIGEPIDVAYAALFLASDESKYITGQEFVIDGGATAGAKVES